MSKPKIIIVGGPTASGKSGVALKLAEEFDGEIISSDSMQIYKRLDIGTAKPTLEEQARVRHHLVDIVEPWENYSAADFVRDAKAAIEDVSHRGKLPVICGGTGLYIEALIHPTDYSSETDADEELRAALMEKDAHELWLQLEQIDPEAAAKTHENNKKRVVRALEIYYKTGKTKTETDKEQKKYEPEYDVLLLLTGFCDREVLYGRINRRVDEMISAGLAEETKRLLETGDLRPGTTAYQAIGYKELFPYINGESSLEECIEKLKQATRNYAKRQLTWFGRYGGVKVQTYEEAERAVKEFLERS
ncbi:MAG: tRNA (adenosine(37)-N6)-dimethylallyltransferase MiaA [Clostridia bacterium]|nr:tRNA (adenosine(37)-N6)-dimethylallyltransferase MiaA [Clostridia bacterium]